MNSDLIAACRHAIRQNLGVREGETVVIVSDGTKSSIVTAFEHAARDHGAEVEVVEIPLAQFNGQEPPEEAASRMRSADVVLMPVSRSLSWTKARMAATDAGARIASMAGGLDEAVMLRTFKIDYEPIRERVNRICDLLDRAESVRIESVLGTDLHFSIAGREAHGRKGGIYVKPGAWGNLPCGEAFIAPVEWTATGQYIVDASHAPVGRLARPIRIRVEDGYAVSLADGEVADELHDLLKRIGDRNAFSIAEFGIGCNHQATVSGATIEDEKALGTCHIALGSNHLFGGAVEVGSHVDGIIKSPTIYLDDEILMREGQLQELR